MIVKRYNSIRNNKCYCGHTITCDCGDAGIDEFKKVLHKIPETILIDLTS